MTSNQSGSKAEKLMPRYPVYVPTKGRAHFTKGTINALQESGTPFHFTVVEAEVDQYTEAFGDEGMIVLPAEVTNLLETRNWIRQHSIDTYGARRHWQFDDNIRNFMRRVGGKCLVCDAGVAIRLCEDFTDRYENVGIAGMNYSTFVRDEQAMPPFYVNQHVYSASLIDNEMPYTWRLIYNDDTDLCLQVLSGGLCTILFNAFCVEKVATMTVSGGNTNQLYEDDGRLVMSRSLERMWPGIVSTDRRFKRPQHVVHSQWRKFDTKLIRRADVDLDSMPATDEHGMKIKQVSDKIESKRIRRIYEQHRKKHT